MEHSTFKMSILTTYLIQSLAKNQMETSNMKSILKYIWNLGLRITKQSWTMIITKTKASHFLISIIVLAIWTAITKLHRPSDLKNKNLFSIVLEVGISKITVQFIWFLMRVVSVACRHQPFVHTWRESLCTVPSAYRTAALSGWGSSLPTALNSHNSHTNTISKN